MKYKDIRIKNMIVEEISKAISMDSVKDPRIPKIVTFTKITLSKDLHYCHIYFSVLGTDADKTKALTGLNSAAGFFQKLLADNLRLQFTPKIEFRIDTEEEKAYQVDKLLAQIAKEKEENEKKDKSDPS